MLSIYAQEKKYAQENTQKKTKKKTKLWHAHRQDVKNFTKTRLNCK